MSIRSSVAFIYCTCIIPAVGAAQNSDVPTIAVMTFQSSERGLGSRAAEMLRDKLTNDFSSDELHTVPTADVSANLEAAGFSIDEQLAPNDERQLANLLRADIYVTGSINQVFNGDYHLEPRLVMPVDLTLVQSLPPIDKKDLDGLMGPLSKSIKLAIRQLQGNRKCIAGVNSKNFAAAVAGARAAIAVYPRASIARRCMAKAFFALYVNATSRPDSVGYADSVLAVSEVILQEDSLSVPMLKYNAALYKFLSDTARERRALLSLAHAEPNNTQLIEQVINSLAEGGRVQDATQLIKDLLAKNPGDAHILDLAFKVYTAAGDWQAMAEIGPQLIKADTAAADTTYFIRMMSAYVRLNQLQQMIDLLAQATAKFPNNGLFWVFYAKELDSAGQSQQAVDALRRAITLGPGMTYTTIAYNLLINIYDKANAPDSVYDIAQRAMQVPSIGKGLIAKLVLSQGNKLFQAGASASGTVARANLQSALKFLQLSNQIEPSVEAQLLKASATFQLMQSATGEADTTKSCSLAQLAKQSYQDVGPLLQGVATSTVITYQQQAHDMLGYLPKFQPAIESQVKRFCK